MSIRKALQFVQNETSETDTELNADQNSDEAELKTTRYMRIHGRKILCTKYDQFSKNFESSAELLLCHLAT